MSDLKRIIEEEKRKKRAKENEDSERFRNSSAFRESGTNDRKSDKLLSFAGSVLQKFERQTGLHFEYLGKNSSFGWCKACYGFFRYEQGLVFRKKYKAGEVIIGLSSSKSSAGFSPASVLNFGGEDVGRRVEFDDITEEWFMRKLAEHYVNLL